MSNEKFANVWDAIEDTPEEAENMKLRSGLMMALKTPCQHCVAAEADLTRGAGNQ